MSGKKLNKPQEALRGSGLKAGASEVLYETVTVVAKPKSPRDAASGKATS